MKKLSVEELKYYYYFDFKIEDLNELFLESEINKKMISDCINNIILNNNNIDLYEFEYYGLYLYNIQSIIELIRKEMINSINNYEYDKLPYLYHELQNALIIDNSDNSDYELYTRCNDISEATAKINHYLGKYELKEFNSIDYLDQIWNNKNLMNYLLNL